MCSEQQTDRDGQKPLVELMRKNKVFVSIPFLHFHIHHHVITAGVDLSGSCEGHSQDILHSLSTTKHPLLFMCVLKCVCVCLMCVRALLCCIGKQVMLVVCIVPQSLFAPAGNINSPGIRTLQLCNWFLKLFLCVLSNVSVLEHRVMLLKNTTLAIEGGLFLKLYSWVPVCSSPYL